MKSLILPAGLLLAPCLLAPRLSIQAQAPAQTGDPPGISAPWDVSQTVAALQAQTLRVKPVLDQLSPRDWVQQGAPEAYVAQWESAERELSDVGLVARALEKQPDRLTLALDAYFRLQSLETRLNSLVDGARRYQNPALGDEVVGALGESASNRDKLRDYITDLAAQKEQEFSTVDKEAQRCRATLNRQSPPPRTAPVKAPKAAPKQP